MSRSPLPAAPDRESVWDYPRPPRVEATSELIVVTLGGLLVTSTTDAVRVLETSHPPVYYLPLDAFAPGMVEPADGSAVCEYKGVADHVSLRVGDRLLERVGWTYPTPLPGYEVLAGRVALYAGELTCTVDREPVVPQAGGYYGGWITPRVIGPFKGEPGTAGW
ncbi:DUF427 domain-containing protein [Cellulomonas fengjieae]|uniref:DUF427 domain-containing protein n=1 Tax=Cellulomonas fengjieae TaxID=2819978 RepID=A0ABS3SJT0_9CELL|nr:DUF427 domain-containing protein [Cellulomonas fengjieae]MBO3085220.1 DUF427 domain-containing protein [Cellulomonas fengjieae]QVI66214.1 DUF427 domain-containing protein [Cellulomonas fengjieae]